MKAWLKGGIVGLAIGMIALLSMHLYGSIV